MKRTFRHIKNNAVIYTAHSLSLFIAALFYYKLIGIYATGILFCILAIYALCMALGQRAQKCYHKYEKEDRLTQPNELCLAIAICCPIYWCWMIVGMIPITSYEAWLLTGLPINLIGWFPLREAAMKVRLKTVFWSLQISIYLLLLVICQLILPFLL
ncbi:MAG: hypothetical protein E7616_09190 [Ruminococcaceae bacterium]|nr:hypothetical protein [Oscillospiraceae bacterium]